MVKFIPSALLCILLSPIAHGGTLTVINNKNCGSFGCETIRSESVSKAVVKYYEVNKDGLTVIGTLEENDQPQPAECKVPSVLLKQQNIDPISLGERLVAKDSTTNLHCTITDGKVSKPQVVITSRPTH